MKYLILTVVAVVAIALAISFIKQIIGTVIAVGVIALIVGLIWKFGFSNTSGATSP